MVNKIRILVVEDDEQIKESLANHLLTEGYEVEKASSGNEAIPLILGKEFNLVVLDLKMPYIDGFEVLKFIKGTFPKTKVIILTAYADLVNIEKCRKMGADEIIGKPYDLEYLFTVIEKVMRK